MHKFGVNPLDGSRESEFYGQMTGKRWTLRRDSTPHVQYHKGELKSDAESK